MKTCPVITVVNAPDDSFRAFQKTLTEALGRDAVYTSLQPTILANAKNNLMPQWRLSLTRVVSENPGTVVVNRVAEVGCEELTDFNRSVRALFPHTRHPLAFHAGNERVECSQYTASGPLPSAELLQLLTRY